jgi:hypothetical protein
MVLMWRWPDVTDSPFVTRVTPLYAKKRAKPPRNTRYTHHITTSRWDIKPLSRTGNFEMAKKRSEGGRARNIANTANPPICGRGNHGLAPCLVTHPSQLSLDGQGVIAA